MQRKVQSRNKSNGEHTKVNGSGTKIIFTANELYYYYYYSLVLITKTTSYHNLKTGLIQSCLFLAALTFMFSPFLWLAKIDFQTNTIMVITQLVRKPQVM